MTETRRNFAENKCSFLDDMLVLSKDEASPGVMMLMRALFGAEASPRVSEGCKCSSVSSSELDGDDESDASTALLLDASISSLDLC